MALFLIHAFSEIRSKTLGIHRDSELLLQTIENNGTLTIKMAFDLEQTAIKLRIEDTGRGINPEIVHKLFDPFYTTKPKGTGLGLAISRQMIEDHNGTIEVDVTSVSYTHLTLPTNREV